MKLSLCIATFNEEQFIRYPLDSAYDIVDEVVIVDGGSTDKTLEIVRSYGDKVKVIQTDNPPMFHMNKQKALEAAKGEWILQLDADEALSAELKEEIQKVTSVDSRLRGNDLKESTNVVAYWLPRKNFFLNRFLEKGGQYPDYTIRLYLRGAARFPCKTVHENVEVTGAVGYLKKPLLHYADPDFVRYLRRWDRYTSLDAELFTQESKTVPSFINYFFWKPAVTFFLMYFRHKGFMDGFPGFVFALFSSIRFWVIYIKVWQKNHTHR